MVPPLPAPPDGPRVDPVLVAGEVPTLPDQVARGLVDLGPVDLALVVEDGRTTVHTAVGHAVRYKAGPVELPAAQRVAMRTDSIFDLASLTKVYTAILVLQLVDRGQVDLDEPVQTYLPEFTGAGKSAVTIAQLLAHTSALPVGMQYAAEITAPTPEGTSNGLIQLAGQASVFFVVLMSLTRTPSGSFTPSLAVLAALLLVAGLVASRLPEPARHIALRDLLADAGAEPHGTTQPEGQAQG